MNQDKIKVAPSINRPAWTKALHQGDNEMLDHLFETEDLGTIHFELATFINGMYRMCQMRNLPIEVILPQIKRVLPLTDQLRSRLGWRQRELDLGLMEWIRRSSALTVVIGAGATIAAGGPSWAELVQLLLKIAVEKGHEIAQMVKTPESTPESTSWKREVKSIEHLKPEEAEEAKRIIALIENGKAKNEELMRGAQICYDLFGQELFTHITGIIYERAKEPSAIHRAIAELAHPQPVPDRGRGLFPGWDCIVTYNFDSLMSEALTEQKVPHAAWAMKKGQMAGDPDELAKQAGQDSPYQRIYHMHGYTPRKMFLITHIDFVFSTAQYFKIYGDEPSGIIAFILNNYFANPVHIALYIGCSFSDEYMNNILKEAASRYPGRLHYAILRLPKKFQDKEPNPTDLEKLNAPYREMGVQPIWIHNFDEIPAIIRRLK